MPVADQRPLDTSTLGPVRVDPNRIAARAHVVREAMRHMTTDPTCCAQLPLLDRSLLHDLAHHASDDTLVKLLALLK